ncbi:MAG: hypothetical protein ACRCXL_02815 [Dermatophilaceae bacterium]
MKRRTVALDRAAVFLVGLLLVGAGLAGFAWWRGDLGIRSDALETEPVTDAAEQSWWPWALATVGLILVLAGARWLVAHLVSTRVREVRLPGTGRDGRLTVQVTSVARTAGDVLADTPGVRSASGAVARDRGILVMRLRATIEPGADLAAVASAADRVAADLGRMLQRDDIACRVDLRVARRGKNLPRVT